MTRPLMSATSAAFLFAVAVAHDFPVLPGADRLGVGYDAVFGVSRTLPVVDLSSFGEGRTFEVPFTQTTYRVPDQAHVHTGTEYKSTTKVYHSSHAYAHDQSLDVSASVSFGPWLSMSTDVKTAHETLKGGQTVLSETRQRTVVYEAAVVPPAFAMVAKDFAHIASHLPDAYNATAYRDFILYYGTHVVMGASFGGETRLRATVTSSYFSEHSDVDIGVQTSIKWFAFSAGASASHDASSSSAWNQSRSTFSASSVGGNPVLDWTSDYSAWASSVYVDPGEITVSLEPLSAFVSNANVSANLDTAIEAYRASYPLADDGGADSLSQLHLSSCQTGNLVQPLAGVQYITRQIACPTPGKVPAKRNIKYDNIPNSVATQWWDTGTGMCCSPSFTIDNVPPNRRRN